MADMGIRQDFIDGVQEIYTTLLTDGVNDGLNYYPCNEKTSNVYGESKFRSYLAPILLVCSANLSPEHQGEVEKIKNIATFKVPLKSLQEKEIDITPSRLENLISGIIEFQGVFYEILKVSPATFVENTFLMYHFSCEESTNIHEMVLQDDFYYPA